MLLWDVRRIGNGPRNGDAWLFAARQRTRTVIASLAKPDHGKQLFGALRRLLTAESIQHLRNHHIL